MMHGQRVGVVVSHFLQLLIEFHPVQLFRLLAGKVGGKCELSPECLLVWTETRVQVWSGSKTQQDDHGQPTRPIVVAVAVTGN